MPLLPAALLAMCAPHVAPSTMMAIVRTESGGNPLVIGINGHRKLARQPANATQAIHWARWLVAHGYNFDAGLMQVNISNWATLGVTPETVFDPCTNLKAGAQILSANYAKASNRFGHGGYALRAAISAYNTGNFAHGFSNGYVRKVERNSGLTLAGAADRPPLVTSNVRSDSPIVRRTSPSPPNPYQSPSAVASFALAGSDAGGWDSAPTNSDTTGPGRSTKGNNP